MEKTITLSLKEYQNIISSYETLKKTFSENEVLIKTSISTEFNKENKYEDNYHEYRIYTKDEVIIELIRLRDESLKIANKNYNDWHDLYNKKEKKSFFGF